VAAKKKKKEKEKRTRESFCRNPRIASFVRRRAVAIEWRRLMDFFGVQSAPGRGGLCRVEDAGAAPPSSAGAAPPSSAGAAPPSAADEADARVWDDRRTIWAPPVLEVTLQPCQNSLFKQGFQEDHFDVSLFD
jgi:hypothetical protein